MLETLKKHQLLANIKKCEFSQQTLVYLGYVIGGGEMKIDPSKLEAIMKWSVPTNVSKVISFFGAAQCMRKFIASFSMVVAPLHTIIASGKSFHWGKGYQRDLEDINNNIIQALVMELPKLQRPFEVETNVSGYVMGVVLMQGGRHVYYHPKLFHGEVLNYPTYHQELYAMV